MFDPAQPATNSALSSAVMRSQLTSLKALIDAILTVTAAQVDGTTTLSPGDSATVSVVVDGNTLRFTFGIPRGQDGLQGGPGDTGPQGPPFAQAIVDAVTTLDPGHPANVQVGFDGTNVHFTFSIPRGETGGPGEPGIQGPPGEVSNAALAAEIATTALNPASITPLTLIADPSYNAAQLQQISDKLDELLNAIKRL